MEKQRCIGPCGKRKNLDQFYTHPQMKNGHVRICIECQKKRVKLRQETEAGKLSERKRNQKPERRAALARTSQQWRINNPEKYKAHCKVAYALRKGTLIKPSSCQECGSIGKLHSHHEDYSKPLDVDWLCVPCHGKRNPNFIPF